jgi:hypothetical protein
MKLLSSLSFGLVLVAASACVAGCAQDSADIGSTSEDLGTGVDVPNPSGAYFANVSANGTGCPAGTWDASISDDGSAFTITFANYETQVGPGQAFSIKDCSLGLDIRTGSGFTFAIDSFYYQGYSLLDSGGMSAKQTAKYYFMGNPANGPEFDKVMTGPYDDDYLFSDEIATESLVWSPCGATRRLNVTTRLVLQNNPAKTGSGYLNTSTVDVTHDIVFRFGFRWRKC